MLSKADYDKFISSINKVGIKKYNIRCEGGNRIIYHNEETSFIIPFDEYVICLESTKNYATSNGRFNLIMIPYDNIDDIKVDDLPFDISIDLSKELGIYEKVKEFMKNVPARQGIVPGTAGLDSVKDKTGTIPTISPGYSGYVTK